MIQQDSVLMVKEPEENNQKQNETKRELEQLAKLFSQTQKIAHLGTWELIFETQKTTWSDEFCNILGVLPEEIQPCLETFLSYVHPEDRDFVRQITEAGETNNREVSFYCRIIRKDGFIRHIYTESKFEFDNDGKPRRMYGIIHDVTEMKLAEEKLRQSETNLRLIMNVVPHSIFAKDRDGRFIFANEAFGELYGMDPEKLINNRMVDLIPVKSEAQKFVDEDRQILDSGKGNTLKDVTFTDSKGNLRIFQTNKMPFTPVGSTEKGILSIAVEVTERKLTEEKLRKSESALLKLNAELEEHVKLRTIELVDANNELEAFSYSVSHDLRTPVRAMEIFSNLLKNQLDGDDNAVIIDYLGNILKCTAEMNDLINDLLEFSRLGRSELEKDNINMELLVKTIVDELTLLEVNKKFEIKIGNLASVNGDRKIIKSVWHNLVANAIKFSKEGEVCRIQITSKRDNDMITYSVEDNGVGFDMQYYDRLFKPFSRLHVATEYRGTGAGLAICERIVKRHGGIMWANSVLNEGSTFCFSLPIG